MSHSGIAPRCAAERRQAGFTLIELMIVLAILMTVSAIVATGLFQMTMTQGAVWNRTEMHGAVRSATELLQQEIGQAGRITLPATVTLSAPVLGNATSQTVGVTSSAGMFRGMQLVIGPDAVSNCPGTQCGSQETVQLTAVGANTITAIFQDPHAIGALASAAGAFAAGIVPTQSCVPPLVSGDCKIITIDSAGATQVTTLTATTGSTGSVLKLFGDINGDGNVVYVEYKCDMSTTPGTFTRRVIPFDTAAAKSTFPAQVLLSNLLANPGSPSPPCFDYQRKVVTNNTYVINVTLTMTIQTQDKDPKTQQFQTETKALLNVSPRNVYEAWQLSSAGILGRIQPMPYSVTQLLP